MVALPFRYRVSALTQSRVDLLEHRRPGAKILRLELVERSGVGVEVAVEVFGVGGDVEEAGEDFALLGGAGDEGLGADLVGGVVVGVELAEAEHGAAGA